MRTDSLPFLSLFGSRKRRKLYYLGKEDFYQSRNALNVSSAFNFHSRDTNQSYSTEKHIRFYGVEFGKTQKEIRRLFGKPNFAQKKGLPLDTQITLFYKLNVKGIKCILQMHLYRDQLFFAQIQLTDSNAQIKKVFLELFRMKYKVNELDWNNNLKDADDNRIALQDDIVPKASYFTGNKALWQEIRSELSSKEEAENSWDIDIKKIALKWS
ncbi:MULTISPECIES: hypothetical protein [Roseivirga]|uniref:hypothetical protein n=1 Tax=Roseivirga TaxID=290180 RepID=UPI00167B3232|nr:MULTISPECIES: hypothetical protein [Roseivirga]MEC7753993.1 hypothetical protein [Bacteroidota bacterium]|tara:strand:+ start:15546 stop:16181 length:636 start_codon:yes stop_codon:yes gene_type:complete